MARRRYQTGCIFKRGKRRKVWVARWREDVIKPDGSRGRIQRSVVLGLVSEISTRRQAQTLLADRLRLLNRGLYRPQSTVLMCDYIESEWTNLILPTLKLSTQRGYRVVLRRHLQPYWGEWRLCDVSKLDIQQFVAEKFRQGLAWQTVRNCWITLSSILDSAVEYGYLAVNPARGVKFPPQAPQKEPKILTAEAFTLLLDRLREPFRTMVALTALTGFRTGELLALHWRAVDLSVGTVRVCESVFQGQFQRPKSERSIRTVPVGPVARWLLETHLQRSACKNPDDLVFSGPHGGPYRDFSLTERVLQPAAKAAGIGRVTWHQLRHVHASILHDLGVPAKIAQQQLGHATVQTTLNLYTHTIPETHRRAVEALERVLFPNVPNSADSNNKNDAGNQ
ncbi:MAG TPA: tyrosine-type recombinase/integrase [Terriglobia bacterium]|nr:tyrosine-type recombinase/integrase [Terriglobia bacterium]